MTFFSWLFKKCGIDCNYELERYNCAFRSTTPLRDEQSQQFMEEGDSPYEIHY